MYTSVLTKKLLRDIKARKIQFSAIILTLLIGVAFYSSLNISMDCLTTSYDYAYDFLNYADFTVYLHSAPISVLHELKNIDNVENVEGRLSIGIGIHINETRQIAGLAIGINSTHRPTVNNVKIETGRYFYPNETNVCLLERHFANAYGYSPSNNVTLIIQGVKQNFTVVGVVASPEFLIVLSESLELSSGYTYGVVFLPIDTLQKLLAFPSTINEIVATVKDKSKINETIASFRTILSSYGIIRIVKGTDQPGYKALK